MRHRIFLVVTLMAHRVSSPRCQLRRKCDAMTRSKPRKAPAAQKISIDDALQMAIAVHQGGNPRLASEHYGAILQAAPDHPDAMHYLALASWQLGKQAIALRQMARALELAPDNADAR